ncbi:FtsW/RodA/SpoVE family cell cycle protein [Murimonas intestini]|uniref:Probable peptidoglycan glycosyltransferase FtsW n=1 Tax=Murimonas intestini TaxID=1337051 RepID=A0AB73SYE2_9FIRM|nr:FtsW/RodA/SpoVE family cell cycle protein [Murimonas intestini]MCR1868364.1 FtsW/RodA/SpoVE family cell cycle protein [Murimonas intestini]MCR1885808.1 FtsW/RodA/SpoVE family cell cycle protein [Murimonas intestini]
MNTDEYINTLTEQIRCKKARHAVAEEIRAHIEDQKQEYLCEGADEAEAEEMAVKEMGDPIEAGVALDTIHRPKMAWGMIALMSVLSILGLVLQYLVHLDLSKLQDNVNYPGSPVRYIIDGITPNTVIVVILGLAAMILVCYLDYSRIGLRSKEITVFLFLAIILWQWAAGLKVNGRQDWIPVGSIEVSISMLIYLFIPLYAGIIYNNRGKSYMGFFESILWMLPALFISIRIPSAVTTIVLLLTFAVILTAAVSRGWFRVSRKYTIGGMWAAIALFPAFLYILAKCFGNEYQIYRLQAYAGRLTQWITNPDGNIFYLTKPVNQMLSGGRLIGAGELPDTAAAVLGKGNYYMLTYVAAFYGILAAAALAGAVIFVFFRFFRISLRQKNQLGMIMGAGCSAAFLLQTAAYIINNLGIIPTEINAPFISYGGAGTVVTYILLGLLLSIYRYQNVLPAGILQEHYTGKPQNHSS